MVYMLEVLCERIPKVLILDRKLLCNIVKYCYIKLRIQPGIFSSILVYNEQVQMKRYTIVALRNNIHSTFNDLCLAKHR